MEFQEGTMIEDNIKTIIPVNQAGIFSRISGIEEAEVLKIINAINSSYNYYLTRLDRICKFLGLERQLDFYMLYRDLKCPRGYHDKIHVAMLVNHLMDLYIVYHAQASPYELKKMVVALIFHNIFYHKKSEDENTLTSIDFFEGYCKIYEVPEVLKSEIVAIIQQMCYPYKDIAEDDPQALMKGFCCLLDNSMFISSYARHLYALLVFKLYRTEVDIEHDAEIYKIRYMHYIRDLRTFIEKHISVLQGQDVIAKTLLEFDPSVFVTTYFMDDKMFKLFSNMSIL